MNTNSGGTARPEGQSKSTVYRDLGKLQGVPSYKIVNWLKNRRRELPASVALYFAGMVEGTFFFKSDLQAKVYRADWSSLAPWQAEKLRALLRSNYDLSLLPAVFGGQTLAFGTISQRVVTTAGVNYIVDAFQNTTEVENFKFHGYGTGTAAEATSDTGLGTELTTEYAVDSTRPTGSQGEGASANIYRTTATLSPDSGGTLAITEHGVFSAASAGTLLDRSKFSAINLVAGSDSLQTQYDLTVSAGG